MPGDCGDGGTDRFLDVFGNPPVIFLFKVADCDNASTRADGKFGFRGGPADEGGGSVDTEEDEGWLIACWGGFPD